MRSLTARLLVQDALALDNTAATIVPLATPSDVQLIASQPATMQRVLSALPFVRLHPVEPGQRDVGGVPDGHPGRPARPTPQGSAAARQSTFRQRRLHRLRREPRQGLISVSTDQDAPLVQGVDLDALRLDSTFTASFPGWADLVLGTRDAPLIFDGRLGARVRSSSSPSIRRRA